MQLNPDVPTHVCPNCCNNRAVVFYQVDQLPIHTVQLLRSRQEALDAPLGNITLGFCHTCGFITNLSFDPDTLQYNNNYDNTRRHSHTFSGFEKELAVYLVNRYALHGKTILEIGCGQGEFITTLCEIGNNVGVGFDPAFVRQRSSVGLTSQAGITFIQDVYSEKYANYRGDFVVCKMTLEHLPETAVFLNMMRRAIEPKANLELETILFFQVPNTRHLLNEVAFWDIHYEHCSYFTPASLGYLFRQHNLEILDLYTGFDDQYIMIEARPANGRLSTPHPNEEPLEELADEVVHFTKIYPQKLSYWRNAISEWRARGQKVVLWGAGSKSVSFLTTLGITTTHLKYVVDVNPRKIGTHIAGTGQKIISPQFLEIYRPDIVIVMNPIYQDEVRHTLYELDLTPQIIGV